MSDEKRDYDNKFYLVAQAGGFYDGAVQLPTGTKYGFPKGRGLYANKGPAGDWYRGDLIALDHDRFAEDARIDGNVRPAGMDERSSIKPLELRLNPWIGGKTDLIGTIWTSEGLFTVFADKGNERGQLVLKGAIRPAVGKNGENLKAHVAEVAEQYGIEPEAVERAAKAARKAMKDGPSNG